MIERSAVFDAYYTAQSIVPSAAEFETFVSTLLTPLPVTFRVNPLQPDAAGVISRLSSEFSAPFVLDSGSALPPPRELPWYRPAHHAWHVSVARHDLRKSESLKKLHSWVLALNEGGGISRQEAVSMIPPMLLDVQPHHAVLDMCASPGSKTAQVRGPHEGAGVRWPARRLGGLGGVARSLVHAPHPRSRPPVSPHPPRCSSLCTLVSQRGSFPPASWWRMTTTPPAPTCWRTSVRASACALFS